jgi:acetoin utilization protein AcuC
MSKLMVAYDDAYLNWKLGSGDGSHPTNPIRAKLAVELLKQEVPAFEIIEPTYRAEDREKLESIHTAEYVSEVLDSWVSLEWAGANQLNATTAAQMFAGTARLVEQMLEGNAVVGFNPQGAKHHAHRDQSSGFCVFNDLAWAALEFEKYGVRAAYIDWDAHAGDGVQHLLTETDIPTFSIHGDGIFPNLPTTSLRGMEDNYLYANTQEHWYNYNIQEGGGDEALAWALADIGKKLESYKPEVILLAAGADGHKEDGWGLGYSYEGFDYAAKQVRGWAEQYSDGKVLIGGAGGYKPYSATPRTWANVVKIISS